MQTEPGEISLLTALAYQYGPFFFAVLYDVVIAGWAAKRYSKICARTDPPSTPEERSAHRVYFFFTWSFGGLVTILAVCWFFMHQPIYTFEGVIRNLKDGEVLWSDSAWFQTRFDSAGKHGQTRDETFIVMQNHPFAATDHYSIKFRKPGDGDNDGPVSLLDTRYADDDHDYVVVYDSTLDANVLKPTHPRPKPPKITFSFPFLDEAQAATLNAVQQATTNSLTDGMRTTILNALTGDRVYAGTEIQALDTIRRLSPSDRASLLQLEGKNEPIIVTLLDLTRHQDDELRLKATGIIRGFDVKGLFVRKLADTSVAPMYRSALLRIDTNAALWVLAHVPHTPELRRIRDRIGAAGYKPRLISASSARTGDRFWIAVYWPSGDFASQNCVAVQFKQAEGTDTGGDAIIEPTARRMYAYSKLRVISLADAVEGACRSTSPNFAHG